MAGEPDTAPDELKAMLRPFEGELKIWPVSPRMNRAEAAKGPEVIDKVELPAEEKSRARRKRWQPSWPAPGSAAGGCLKCAAR